MNLYGCNKLLTFTKTEDKIHGKNKHLKTFFLKPSNH